MTDPRPAESPAATTVSSDETRLDSLLDMTLPVTVEFGSTTMTIQEALELAPGSVIQLDRLLGDPVEVRISDRRLAEAEVVVVGDHFGVRITRVLTDGVRGG
ncbi:MAG TPA: FliM/FliN family flagellar motor switch protein [Gemmatimonadales bacterium]|nr:FliM/FliN family flagellar motor switch protein [Gemmatimonadales bacterium]